MRLPWVIQVGPRVITRDRKLKKKRPRDGSQGGEDAVPQDLKMEEEPGNVALPAGKGEETDSSLSFQRE